MRPTLEEFAAARRDTLDRMDESLGGVVATALFRYLRTPQVNWQAPILREMARLWTGVVESEGGEMDEQAQRARDAFLSQIEAALERTTPPSGALSDRRIQTDRITRWLSTATVNSATMAAAAQDDEPLLMEWVTMGDEGVREIHRPLNGQQAPIGETFDVAGTDLRYPGEPVGPPEVWIQCRCVLRPTLGGDEMGNETTVFATDTEVEEEAPVEVDDILDPEAPVVEDGILDEVPFYGVLAPLGAISGDRRRLSAEEGAITWRDGASPVVLRWAKADVGGHGGAIRVGMFSRIWVEDGNVMAEGTLLNTPEAQEVMSIMAQGAIGVSIDLDQMLVAYVNEDGSAFDFDTWDDSKPDPIMEVSEGRIAGATLVDIPAFQEAFIAMGTWAESNLEASCIPCEAATAVEAMTEAEREEFEQALMELATEGAFEKNVVASIEGRASDRWLAQALLDAYVDQFAPGTKDGPGWITNPEETARLRRYWTKGAGAAKIRWGQPGDFTRCERELRKYIKNPAYLAGTCANLHKVATGMWPGDRRNRAQIEEGAIMASAFTISPPEQGALVASARPASWFQNPGLAGPTPLTIEDDGHVYGHVATWDVCHIGSPKGACTLAPRTITDYAYFKTGLVRTTEGDVPVGHITMGTGHAGLRLNHSKAAAHYDNTGAVVADITVGEDQFGIWFSGALRPNVSEEDVEVLRSAALSGDWRGIRGNSELVAALAVNVPGFPIPRMALAASADEGQYALVAAGVLWAREGQAETFDVGAVADAVVERLDRRERTRTLRSLFRAPVDAQREADRMASAQRLAAVRSALG